MKESNLINKLAIDGGIPVRDEMLPYGRQSLYKKDIEAVVDVLQSDWLTTGPKVGEFEAAFADSVGVEEAVVVNSGTAALHAAMYAIGISSGDEVILPAITFVATANCVLYQGGIPIFADVDPDTMLIDVTKIESKITSKTKAIIAVDYAGQPCDYDALRNICDKYGLILVSDACHSLGATYKSGLVGTLANLTTFSFHPVKVITSGEGGMITCSDNDYAIKMRNFRNHGITTDHRQRALKGAFLYHMEELGFNYRLSDFQCALGMSQLHKLEEIVSARQSIALKYNEHFTHIDGAHSLKLFDDVTHAYHLYVIKLDLESLRVNRDTIFAALRAENIGVNVHYLPVYQHPFYQSRGLEDNLCPVAEVEYDRLLSIPIFPSMSDQDIGEVIEGLNKVINTYHL